MLALRICLRVPTRLAGSQPSRIAGLISPRLAPCWNYEHVRGGVAGPGDFSAIEVILEQVAESLAVLF